MTEEHNHNQFQIPEGEIKNQNDAIRARIDAALRPVASESQPKPYAAIKQIEARIHDSRETAIAQLQREESLRASKRPSLMHLLSNLTMLPPKHYNINDLIDQESLRAGAPFGKGHRFWLGAKHERQYEAVDDWYHYRPDPANPKDLKKGVTLHFQTTPTSIHKLYGVNEHPMTYEDTRAFIAAMSVYARVIEDMYSGDLTLSKLQEEIATARPEDFDLAA